MYKMPTLLDLRTGIQITASLNSRTQIPRIPYHTSSCVHLSSTYNELPPIVYIVKIEYMSGVSIHPEYGYDDDGPDLSPFKEDVPICQMLIDCAYSTVC